MRSSADSSPLAQPIARHGGTKRQLRCGASTARAFKLNAPCSLDIDNVIDAFSGHILDTIPQINAPLPLTTELTAERCSSVDQPLVLLLASALLVGGSLVVHRTSLGRRLHAGTVLALTYSGCLCRTERLKRTGSSSLRRE